MKPPESEPAGDDLLRQREGLRRNFVRASAAVAVILVALLALAVAAVVASVHAGRDRELAVAATQERQQELASALLAEARAVRLGGQAGCRSTALLAISNAAALGPTPELRSEAIACLALDELTTARTWPQTQVGELVAIDGSLRRLAYCNDGQHIKIQSTATNAAPVEVVFKLVLEEVEVTCVGLEFSPGGKYLAARLNSGGLTVWNADTGQLVLAYATNHLYRPRGMPSFSADERWLYLPEAEQATNLLRMDLAHGGMEALPIPISPAQSLFRVRPDGGQVAVANRNRVEVWDLKSRALERTLDTVTPVAALAWSHGSGALAAGCFNGDVLVWDMTDGTMRQFTGHNAGIRSLVFSSNDERLCSAGGDSSSHLWELSSGKRLLTMEGSVLQMNDEAQRLAGYQPGVGLVLWRYAPFAGTRVLRTSSGVSGEGWKTDLSSDGRWLAWAKPDALLLWDLDSSRPPLVVPTTNLYTVCWDPQKPVLFLAHNHRLETRAVAPAPPGRRAGVTLGDPAVIALPTNIQPAMVAISGNGRALALVGEDGALWMGEVTNPGSFVAAAQTANPSGPFGSGSLTGSGRLAVSPDGRWVATVDMADHPSPHIFDAHTGRLEAVLPSATATVGFSADGRWLATGTKTEIALWSVGAWTKVWRRQRTGLPAIESGVAFAGDGTWLVGSESPHLTAWYDRATGNKLAEFSPPDDSFNAGVRLSADARRMVVPTLNGTVLVWDLRVYRQALAALGLDWGQAAPVAALPMHRSGLAGSTGAIVFGLACVTPAAFFALWALGRHRRLLQQSVQSEAEARRRRRELEAARIELMHSQKMKALGTLAAGIAHDFNNLLSVIRMSNKLIGRATQGRAELAEEVANIEEAVLQGKQVVGSMLGYSRERPGDSRSCDLSEVIEESVALLSREFLSGIQLTLALDRDAPPVLVGRGRLEQILLNLLVNAAEAMKNEGKLAITIHREAGRDEPNYVLRPQPASALVELCVADSGPGIAPDILPLIFEPFFTTKFSGTKQGTGLGLSMVHSIAEQEGLGLVVESPAGGGAVFRIFLPAGPAAGAPLQNAKSVN